MRVGKTSVWIVVLNWNNGSDTVECLDSVLDVQDTAISGVVICDNASSDSSVEVIRAWLRRRAVNWLERTVPLPSRDELPASDPLRRLAEPEDAEPLPFILLHTGANLGFAGGNNVGLRFVMRFTNYSAVLLLNNDALLTPGSVSTMAERMAQDPRVGMCGATVVYNWDRNRVQALGGASFEAWLARARHLGSHTLLSDPKDQVAIEAQLDYVLGAALMVSRRCLEAVGCMHEAYFLYYEEIDWALRAKRRGFVLGYAPQALVYHKEGGTIGTKSSSNVVKRSLLSDHFLYSSRMRFTARFYPWFLPLIFAMSMGRACRTVLRGDWRRALVQFRATVGLHWRG